MFLPENQKLLISYIAGARGDFLASILLNGLSESWKNPLVETPKGYIKMHQLYDRLFDGVPAGLTDIATNYSIRIRLSSLDDVLAVTNNLATKIAHIQRVDTADRLVMTQLVNGIIRQERDWRRIDSLFTHIVDFERINDPMFLLGFYHQITGRSLTKETFERIHYNVGLQQQVNLSNYQNYLNIDITEVLKYYELGNGFN